MCVDARFTTSEALCSILQVRDNEQPKSEATLHSEASQLARSIARP